MILGFIDNIYKGIKIKKQKNIPKNVKYIGNI